MPDPTPEEQREKRDAALLALLLLLLAQTEERARVLVAALVASKLTPAEFGAEMQALLEDAHAEAASLGRRLATGTPDSVTEADQAAGVAQADAETEFLARFVADLEGSRYVGTDGTLSEKAIAARAAMYVAALLGTANEAWGESLPPDTQLWWRLGSERPCASCPELEAGSPYTPATIPAWPGAGSTECLSNCRCTVETHDGRSSFDLSREA